jgi:FkbM family methyltransferase
MSVPVLQACASCRVVSFEPSPSSLPYLERTAAGSAYRDRWTVVGKAVGDRAGELDFVVGSQRDALYEGFRSGDRIAGGRVIKVPVTTLDEEWRTWGEPDVSLIKIDVEGGEAAVMNGATALLERRHPAFSSSGLRSILHGSTPSRMNCYASPNATTTASLPCRPACRWTTRGPAGANDRLPKLHVAERMKNASRHRFLGLIGSEVCQYFANEGGYTIHGVDNNQRAVFFGPQGDTRWNQHRLERELKGFVHHELDIRDRVGCARCWRS